MISITVLDETKRTSSQFQPVDLLGKRFGLLIPLEPTHKGQGGYYWDCLCDCGKTTNVLATRLVQGTTKSCGHLKGNKGVAKTHGMRYTKIYRIWRGMRIRCTKSNSPNYYLYGGRGIKVCDTWLKSFESFYEDMKDGYQEGLSLERLDVDGNYCKENCKWIPMSDQAKNKRNTAYLTYKGLRKRAVEWAEIVGAKPRTVVRRVYLGYTPEECLFGKQYEQIRRLILAESLVDYSPIS